MTAKHTPGPWFVSGVRTKMDGQRWLRVLQETPERELAFIPYDDRTDAMHIEATASARLIAAAPDLLAALKYLVTHCKGLDRFEGNPINQAIADANAVIAKAEL